MIKFFLILLITIYLLSYLLLFIFQRKLLYFPSEKYPHSFPTEQFINQDERIETIVLNPGKENAIIYFGGNGESVVHSFPNFTGVFPNHTLYFVNYRGYGGSSGSPTEQGLYSDAQHIYDKLDERHAKLSIIGRSLGSGVATFLASIRPVVKIVLITPYNSIQDIAQERFPIYPMSMLLKDKYDSKGRVKEIKSKTLVILAEHDKVIPRKFSENLIEGFSEEQVLVHTLLGVGHNNLSDNDEYYVLLSDFMQ